MTDRLNSDQDAPAWQPDQLGGYHIGDLVRLPSVSGALEVIGFQWPSTLVLRTPAGGKARAGYQAVSRASLQQIKRRKRHDS